MSSRTLNLEHPVSDGTEQWREVKIKAGRHVATQPNNSVYEVSYKIMVIIDIH